MPNLAFNPSFEFLILVVFDFFTTSLLDHFDSLLQFIFLICLYF